MNYENYKIIMKKFYLIALIIIAFDSQAQSSRDFMKSQIGDGFYFNMNFGTRLAGENSDLTSLGAGAYGSGAFGFMFNGVIGVKGYLGFNLFKAKDKNNIIPPDRSILIQSSLLADLRLSELLDFGTSHIGVNVNGGIGLATLINPSWKRYKRKIGEGNFQDPYFKGNDDMLTLILGVNPKYHLNKHISLDLNFSFNLLFKQDYTIDRHNNIDVDGLTNYMNLSVGFTHRFPNSGSSRFK